MYNASLNTARNKFSEFLTKFEEKLGFQSKLKWQSVFYITTFHVFGFFWCLCYALPVKWQTVAFAFVMFTIGGMGITCGVHRLWTHKCYKATLPLKIYLMLCFASAGQNSMYEWIRDHRLHHKYSDTESDPHNSSRGLVFSHIGWLMMKKNDLVRKNGKQIDMSDITAEPLIMWEKKHSTKLSLIFCYFLPTITGILLWGEDWKCAVAWQCFIRVLTVFHSEMTVNSLAHTFGGRPYNKNIYPRENIVVSTITFGEGWHNYHHTFPSDYKSAETSDFFNWSASAIRLFQRMGVAYDLKEPSKEIVRAVTERMQKEVKSCEINSSKDN